MLWRRGRKKVKSVRIVNSRHGIPTEVKWVTSISIKKKCETFYCSLSRSFQIIFSRFSSLNSETEKMMKMEISKMYLTYIYTCRIQSWFQGKRKQANGKNWHTCLHVWPRARDRARKKLRRTEMIEFDGDETVIMQMLTTYFWWYYPYTQTETR